VQGQGLSLVRLVNSVKERCQIKLFDLSHRSFFLLTG
jgi:hypothetical protein